MKKEGRPKDTTQRTSGRVEEQDNNMPANADVATFERRRQRLVDFLEETLKAESPIESNLGVVNRDLMNLAWTMHQRLTAALAKQPDTIDELDQLTRSIDQYLKVTKQIDRYAQLGIKLREIRSAADSARSELTAAGRNISEELPS